MHHPQRATRREVESAASPIDEFMRRARAEKKRQTSSADSRPESWADPDPAAILGVSDSKHPIKHIVSRRQGRPKSLSDFKSALRRCCERLQGLPLGSLEWDDVLAYPWHHVTDDMAADYARLVYASFAATSSRNDCLSTLRQVMTACHRAGLISLARRDEVLEELPTRAPGDSNRRRRLSNDEIQALMAACEGDRTAERDAAVIAVFATSGMRISELVALDVSDFDEADDTLRLRWTKNHQTHTVFVHPETKQYLLRWLEVRGRGQGALFSWPGGPRNGAPVSPCTVRGWLTRRRIQARVAPFGSHDFRRTFASTLLRTHDISLVGKLLNHKKPGSTMIYDLATQEEQRDAVAGLALLKPLTAPGDGGDTAAQVPA